MSTTPARRFDTDLPDAKGYFGPYGGQLVPPLLKQAMDDIDAAYETIRQRADFQEELAALQADYEGRPSPIFHARRLSKQLGGAQIHLKREDLNHTGAHKIIPLSGRSAAGPLHGQEEGDCRNRSRSARGGAGNRVRAGGHSLRDPHGSGGHRERASQRHEDAHPGMPAGAGDAGGRPR